MVVRGILLIPHVLDQSRMSTICAIGLVNATEPLIEGVDGPHRDAFQEDGSPDPTKVFQDVVYKDARVGNRITWLATQVSST